MNWFLSSKIDHSIKKTNTPQILIQIQWMREKYRENKKKNKARKPIISNDYQIEEIIKHTNKSINWSNT